MELPLAMKRFLPGLLLAVALFSCNDSPKVKPISLHPENPHYFLYKDKPTVLITSGEHYGAVMNLDFDYVTYLQTLAGDGLNLTRVFTGPYVEPIGAFKIESNTLAPAPHGFICPWARTEIAGYKNGGNKFDLTQWDPEYFERLKNFMTEAEKKGIIVELTLFCPFYGEEQWSLSPMNPVNHVNGWGPEDRTHVYTLDKSKRLLAVQENLVRKLVHELRDYDNLIYEICNEPYFGGVTLSWQHHIGALIAEEEKAFPAQHLISQNIANGSKIIEDPHPSVSVFNFHYAFPPLAVSQNYHLDKVIGDNETGFDGNADSTYRREGWFFITAGGALFNNLDYSFTADHEDGTFQYPSTQPGGGSASLRRQLNYLKKFINGFDFIKMKPDSAVVRNLDQNRNVQVLAEKGKQYAIYIWGKGPFDLELSIPEGSYNVTFTDPVTGESTKGKPVRADGRITVTTPAYAEDVAIKIQRISPR
jgi:hypothetical protein